MSRSAFLSLLLRRFVLVLAAGAVPATPVAAEPRAKVTASESVGASSAEGALDGDRFATAESSLWKGSSRSAYWQLEFPEPEPIGAILQINGDDPHVLQNAPRNYAWQVSDDGQTWRTLPETVVHLERRMFRIHRLREPVRTRHLRILINLAHGDHPVLREVEVYPTVDATIAFDDWIVAVSSAEEPESVRLGMPFVNLARECEGWEQVPAQCLWHGDFDMEFVTTEPRPLCAFLTGSFLEWCQCTREPWRGVEEVLKSRRLPMWGACGGAQVLAILDETGADAPWDCPRCRDPDNPRLPIYSHIKLLGDAPCGDYSQSLREAGNHQMQVVAADPAFQGLPTTFEIVENHVGQISFVPDGWVRVVTRGPGAHTVNQCLRTAEAPIYAAQFHMESYATTKAASIPIMSNFLRLAKEWGGYNPDPRPLPLPEPISPGDSGEGTAP